MKLLKYFLVLILLSSAFCFSPLFFAAFEDVAVHMVATNYDITVTNCENNDELFKSVVMETLMSLQKPVKVRDAKYLDRDWIIYTRNMEPLREELKFMVMNTLSELRIPNKPAKHFFNLTDGNDLILKESAIIVADNLSLLETVIEKLMLLNLFPSHIQIVVVCPDVTFKEIETLPDSKILHKLYFLIEEKSSVKLLTFDWFTNGHCDEKQLVVVNEYKSSTGWKNGNFEAKKFFDFHGCQIGIGVIRDFPATFFLALKDKLKNPIPPNQIVYAGYYVTLMKEISGNLNYKYVFNPSLSKIAVDLGEHFSYYHLKNVKVDLKIVSCSNTVYLTDAFLMHVTNAHAFAENLLLVPPGELYTDLEKFLLPFDMATWVYTLIVFVVAIAVIFVIDLCNKNRVKDEVYGVGVRTPILNLFAHFFGVGQNVLPVKDFSRILLMTFVLFSLIIRTAYQSKMFEFLQKDMRRPEVKTIEELIEKNFTFHVYSNQFYLISDLEIFQRAPYIEEKFERLYIDLAQVEIFDPSFKGTIQISSKLMEAVVKVTDGQALRRLLKNYRLNVEAIGMCLPPNHKFFDVMSETTDRLMASGILQRWIGLVYDWKERKYAHLYYDEPKMLSIDDLNFGFLICLISLGFSFLVFCFECASNFAAKCK